MSRAILEVRHLRKYFLQRGGFLSSLLGTPERLIPAVDDVSFYLREKETLSLVGESGCGKTTVARTVLGLTRPTSGSVLFEGKEIAAMPAEELRRLRSRMQMIFQDLDAALNPKMRVRDILKEAITLHDPHGGSRVAQRTGLLLEQVNLKASKLACFPDELSGGEKRRVGIARVLAVGARLIVADEPTSALDVSIQAQVVNLLRDLQERLGLSYLFISHDLRIVEFVSHKVAVMYMGRIVETGLSGQIARAPRHPYTRMLWSSLVHRRSDEGSRAFSRDGPGITGGFDSERPPAGCRFAPRCPVYEANGRPRICTDPDTSPVLVETGPAHRVACHFPLE